MTGTAAAAVVWIDTTPPPPSGALWSDASNWETGTVPTASDDAIIITDQLHGLTPSYPVTIDAPAFAKTVTMNDFGTHARRELINNSSLTIGGALNLGADSIVEISEAISVGGSMEDPGSQRAAEFRLHYARPGRRFQETRALFPMPARERSKSPAARSMFGRYRQCRRQCHGRRRRQADAERRQRSTGGTVTNSGEIDLTGAAVLKNGSLGNSGQINVSGSGNALL